MHLDKHRASLRIVKSLDELDTSGLATARGPNLQKFHQLSKFVFSSLIWRRGVMIRWIQERREKVWLTKATVDPGATSKLSLRI